MSSLNVCSFSGRVVGEPTVKETQTGTSIFKFTIQGMEYRGGEKVYYPVFCTMFGANESGKKRIESLSELVVKGAGVAVSGKYSFREYEVNGQKRQDISFVINEIDIIKYVEEEEYEEEVLEDEDVPF